jgi:cytidine deaminase
MTPAAATLEELKRRAREASRRAHAPYSRYPVGAAVLAGDAIHTGVNVENASFGLTVCAERNAVFAAVAQGATRIDAVAVYTPTAVPAIPCGACLQVIAEFASDAVIICCTDDDASERRFTLRQLLPAAFRLEK